MTWQRIDENTYIDDSLVTCAEYQLFVDEMRGQGKYYQPDHWTSYQFPDGQAREPILGLRHSDAVAFCDWLMRRIDGWQFRLPKREETAVFPVKAPGKNWLGYWLKGHYQFMWINSAGENTSIFDQVITRELNSFSDYFHPDPNIVFDFDYVVNCTREISPALSQEIKYSNTSNNIRESEFIRKLSDDVGNAKIIVRHIEPGQIRSLPKSLNFFHTLDLVRNLARDLKLMGITSTVLASVLETYLQLFILRERIAGRSPAFEGIRLVKERIR